MPSICRQLGSPSEYHYAAYKQRADCSLHLAIRGYSAGPTATVFYLLTKGGALRERSLLPTPAMLLPPMLRSQEVFEKMTGGWAVLSQGCAAAMHNTKL